MQLEDYFEFLSPTAIRLKGHRIGIEHVIELYHDGYIPERIAQTFPGLSLEKIYATITYYLHNRDAIDAYLARQAAIVEQALRENERRWESLSGADRERLGAMARSIVARLLHEPTLRLKGSAGEEDSYRHVQALRELFGIEPPGAELPVAEPPAAEVTSLESRRRRKSS